MSCKRPDPLVTGTSIPLTYQSFRSVETAVRAASLPGEVLGARDRDSDEELLSRARAGDPEAFRVIFDREAPGVRRFLGDLLRDDAGAGEVSQEPFLRSHREPRTL